MQYRTRSIILYIYVCGHIRASGRLFSSMEKTFWLSARVETLSEYYHCVQDCRPIVSLFVSYYLYVFIYLFFCKRVCVKRRTIEAHKGTAAFSHQNEIYLCWKKKYIYIYIYTGDARL